MPALEPQGAALTPAELGKLIRTIARQEAEKVLRRMQRRVRRRQAELPDSDVELDLDELDEEGL